MQLQRRVLSTHHRTSRVDVSPVAHPTAPQQLQPQPGRLPALLAPRSSEVAHAVSQAFTAHLSEHGRIIGGEQSRCLLTELFECLIESAIAGAPYSDRDLNRFRELGTRAVYWKLQPSDLRTAFNVALAAAHRGFWSMAPPEDFVEMAEVTARCARMAELARDACLDGFAGPRSQGAYAQLARKLLAERLIAGDWNAAPSETNTVGPNTIDPDVAPNYLVLVCESASDPDDPIWTRVEEDLSKLRSVPYIVDPTSSTLTALFPTENDDDAPRAARCAADLVTRISDLSDNALYATQAYRPGLANLPATVDEARRLLPLVKAIPDAQIKPYRTDDLLVELALAQQPTIRRRLADLIKPLDAGTGLRRTLEVLLACNLDRESAATELCIHRRTLYYRMDRIKKLSGIDPNTAHGIQLLRAALTSARVQDLESPTTPSSESPAPPTLRNFPKQAASPDAHDPTTITATAPTT